MQIRIPKIKLSSKLLGVTIIALAMVSVFGLSTSVPASAAEPIPVGCPGSKTLASTPAQLKKCDKIPAGCPGSTKTGKKRSGTKCPYSAKARASAPKQGGTTGGDPAASADCTKSACDLIGKYVNPAINLFSVAFSLIAVISIILGSIQYATSEGDPQKASKAKKRIFDTILAVVAYLFLYSFLQFLIPGGLFR